MHRTEKESKREAEHTPLALSKRFLSGKLKLSLPKFSESVFPLCYLPSDRARDRKALLDNLASRGVDVRLVKRGIVFFSWLQFAQETLDYWVPVLAEGRAALKDRSSRALQHLEGLLSIRSEGGIAEDFFGPLPLTANVQDYINELTPFSKHLSAPPARGVYLHGILLVLTEIQQFISSPCWGPLCEELPSPDEQRRFLRGQVSLVVDKLAAYPRPPGRPKNYILDTALIVFYSCCREAGTRSAAESFAAALVTEYFLRNPIFESTPRTIIPKTLSSLIGNHPELRVSQTDLRCSPKKKG